MGLSSSDRLQSLKIHRNVASLSIFCHYFHGNCSSELANCMPPPSSSLATPDFLLTLTPSLSNSLMQELTNIFIPSSLSLVNSGTLFLNLYFHLPTTYTPSKEECQGTSSPKLATLLKSPSEL